MAGPIGGSFAAAVHDFHNARRQGALQSVLARLAGRPTNLLSYEDVRRSLKLQGSFARGLRDIPLDAIVGSVARYSDFTRTFLPRNPADVERWARVMVAASESQGLPPIEVYQVGQVYFVLDGNHRVSVARRFGATTISAYVYEVPTPVPLSPNLSPDELIVKAEYADFLAITQLDELRPGAQLMVTVPGQYRALLEQINSFYEQRRAERGAAYDYRAAVGDWYDEVYLPASRVIHEHNILGDFPGRTETDLYVWILRHRDALQASLGWEVRQAAAVEDFVRTQSPTPQRIVQRIGSKLREAIVPTALDSGPPPGFWRREQRIEHYTEHLIADILVPIGGSETSWQALELAALIARHEHARLHGLFVARNPKADAPTVEAIHAEWERRFKDTDVHARLAIDYGMVADRIVERARWADILVIGLQHPPGSAPLERLSSGITEIIRRSPRSILMVPDVPVAQRALLAYDGSAKAEEALFAATYIALRWQLELSVVTAYEDEVASDTTRRARGYLEQHGVTARFIEARGPAGDVILNAADATASDLIIVGGYGLSSVYEAMFGSTVDHILRNNRRPTLICR